MSHFSPAGTTLAEDEALLLEYGGWQKASKTITYTGATGAGEVGTVTLFTVTGDVDVIRYAEKCTTNLEGAGTLETGWAGDSDGLMAQTADATTIDASDWNNGDGTWVAGGAELAGNGPRYGARIASNIIQTVGSANITGGVIVAYVWYRPLSAGATVVAA